MFDVVMPDKNEESFIDMALSLGYKEIVFLTRDSKYKYYSDRINVRTAFLVSNITQINAVRKNFDYIFANAERQFFESKVDYIINAELFSMKDSFHYKRTALNQVHAKLCKEKGICVVFSFSNLLNKKRIQIMGRMFQNAFIAKKYVLKTDAFSLASTPIDMKSRNVCHSLLRVLGI